MKKIKLSFYFYAWIICFLLIFVFIIINLEGRIISIEKFYLKAEMNDRILKYYDFSSIKNYNVNDLISVNYNNDGSINGVVYDIDATNSFISNNMNAFNELISLNKGDNSFYNDTLIIKVPLSIILGKSVLADIGPVLPLKIYYNSDFFVNLNTKVSSYGINSSLVELFVEVTLAYQVVGSNVEVINTYQYLLTSILVNGNLPSFYTSYQKKSDVFNN